MTYILFNNNINWVINIELIAIWSHRAHLIKCILYNSKSSNINHRRNTNIKHDLVNEKHLHPINPFHPFLSSNRMRICSFFNSILIFYQWFGCPVFHSFIHSSISLAVCSVPGLAFFSSNIIFLFHHVALPRAHVPATCWYNIIQFN